MKEQCAFKNRFTLCAGANRYGANKRNKRRYRFITNWNHPRAAIDPAEPLCKGTLHKSEGALTKALGPHPFEECDKE